MANKIIKKIKRGIWLALAAVLLFASLGAWPYYYDLKTRDWKVAKE